MYVKTLCVFTLIKTFCLLSVFFLGKYKSWATNDAKANARGGASKVKSDFLYSGIFLPNCYSKWFASRKSAFVTGRKPEGASSESESEAEDGAGKSPGKKVRILNKS